MHLPTRRGLTIAVPTLAALAAGGALATAAIPGAGAQIKGCYDKKGHLRVVDPTAKCAKKETQLSWAQRGPQGDAGPKGDKGDAGPAGPSGAQAIIIGGEALNDGRARGALALDGVPGEGDGGRIDIKSFAFSAKRGVSTAGGGGGGGAATISSFRFNKLYDKSSPALFQDTASGQHLKSAVFTFQRPGGQAQDFLTIKLSDVTVTEYSQGGTTEPPLLESVALSAQKVQISYRPQNPDGSLGAPVEAGWDIAANGPA
jgi:type VI secretion system secreted protein Hcp